MTKNVPAPEPATINALLVNEKLNRPTLHTFLEARETTADGPAWEYIFKCNVTGVERRWGIVDRLTFKDLGN